MTRPLLLSLVVLLTACSPDLSLTLARGPSATAPDGEPSLALEPSTVDGGAPSIVRLRVVGAPTVSPEAFVLASGEIGAAQLRQLRSGDVSRALAERLVPVLAWAEGEGEGRTTVIAPTTPLEPGGQYTIASGEPSLALLFHVAEVDLTPTLTRTWPPIEDTRTARFAVYCGQAPLPRLSLPVVTAPLGFLGTLHTGVTAQAGARCLRFNAADRSVPLGARVQLPPLIDLAGTPMRLSPEPLVEGPPPQAAAPVPCEADEIPFGPGCARFEDDRALVRTPDAALLWAIGGDGVDSVTHTMPSEPFLLSPLAPSSAVALSIATYDTAGALSVATVGVTTAAPRPHVIITEILADAIGPEPQQEWVELYNDGLIDVNLGGYVLRDVGGESPLPDVVLSAGGYALLVNDAYLEDDGYDVPPAPGALVIRVGKLGKNGLSNGGEPVDLIDPAGRYASRFMAMKSKEHGQSLARKTPRSPDGWALSFSLASPTPSASNLGAW